MFTEQRWLDADLVCVMNFISELIKQILFRVTPRSHGKTCFIDFSSSDHFHFYLIVFIIDDILPINVQHWGHFTAFLTLNNINLIDMFLMSQNDINAFVLRDG